MTWQIVAVSWLTPHWLLYFNESIGGPQKGHKWLIGSSIDQVGMPSASAYCKGESSTCHGVMDAVRGVRHTSNIFLDNFEPVDMIGYSIYIYHITEEDAARVRAKLLPEEAEVLK